MAFLEVKNIQKAFGPTRVLHGIDFSMEQGQVTVIIGASGGGKTTFLRCLNFLETPNTGTISVGGEVIFDAQKQYSDAEFREKRLRFGLVFQSFNLFPQYTARDNIAMPLSLRMRERLRAAATVRIAGLRAEQKAAGEGLEGAARKEARKLAKARAAEEIGKIRTELSASLHAVRANARARALELLAEVGLSEKADLYPHQLSGGQCQRVAIARALALSPDILCFDEPTSALDPELTGEVLRVIKSLDDDNRTMIIVTHEMEFARSVADHVVFIAGGRIVEQGPPDEIFDHPKTPELQSFLFGHTADTKGNG